MRVEVGESPLARIAKGGWGVSLCPEPTGQPRGSVLGFPGDSAYPCSGSLPPTNPLAPFSAFTSQHTLVLVSGLREPLSWSAPAPAMGDSPLPTTKICRFL